MRLVSRSSLSRGQDRRANCSFVPQSSSTNLPQSSAAGPSFRTKSLSLGTTPLAPSLRPLPSGIPRPPPATFPTPSPPRPPPTVPTSPSPSTSPSPNRTRPYKSNASKSPSTATRRSTPHQPPPSRPTSRTSPCQTTTRPSTRPPSPILSPSKARRTTRGRRGGVSPPSSDARLLRLTRFPPPVSPRRPHPKLRRTLRRVRRRRGMRAAKVRRW